VKLNWESSLNSKSYQLQISTNDSFDNFIYNSLILRDTLQVIDTLTYNSKYYWRVRGVNPSFNGEWSPSSSFSLITPPNQPILISPANGEVNTSLTPTLTWSCTDPDGDLELTYSVWLDKGDGKGLVNIDETEDTSYYFLNSSTKLINEKTYSWAIVANDGELDSQQSEVRSFTIDNIKPSVTINSSEANPTNSHNIRLQVVFSEEVVGFDISDLVIENCTANNLQTVSNTEYTVDIVPASDGELTVDIDSDMLADNAGNGNVAAEIFSITYDSTAPTLVLTSTEGDPTNSQNISLKINFSEEIIGFDILGLSLTNCIASNMQSVSSTEYTVDIVPVNDGELTVDINNDRLEDKAGNGNVAADQFSIIYDGTAPTVVLSTSKDAAVNSENIVLTITFSEEVEGLASSMIALNKGSVTNLQTNDNIIFTADLPPIEAGYMTVDLDAEKVKDLAGNNNIAADQITIVYTGIEELEAKGYQIYPNPVKDKLTLTSSNMNQEVDIQIVTATGQVVFSDKWMSPFTHEIDFTSFSDGLYFIRLQSNGEVITRKVVLVK
jgi:hypothetical protein